MFAKRQDDCERCAKSSTARCGQMVLLTRETLRARASRPSLAFSAAETEDSVPDAMRNEVCITEQTQYYFEDNRPSFRDNIDCENCTR